MYIHTRVRETTGLRELKIKYLFTPARYASRDEFAADFTKA